MVVDVPTSGARPEDVLGAVDAALAGDLAEVRVRVLASGDDPRPSALAALLEADPRVELAAAGTAAPDDAVRVVLPPTARPAEHTLGALRDLLADGAGAVEVAVPGRLGPLRRTALAARLPGTARVRAERPGAAGPSVRVSATRVGLGGVRAPFAGPPPPAGMARERAEHLRHRARSATIRARLDRDAQRLVRETMRADHERARARLLERRIAATSAPRWIAWRARLVARGAYEAARRVWWAVRGTRALARRGWRFARDQVRQRRSPAPGGR